MVRGCWVGGTTWEVVEWREKEKAVVCVMGGAAWRKTTQSSLAGKMELKLSERNDNPVVTTLAQNFRDLASRICSAIDFV